ncbi:MAG TPA: hypothetical protein VHW25_03545 [Steroidobacteraceae bacterium]|jgi:hypothetical protein|nr:hypothetical protein [Steroidobacteraceae bacterium]
MKSALLVVAVLVSGCAGGHLYPVQGPLSEQKPAPVYRIKTGQGDSMTARLGNGEVCHGSWLDIVQEDPTARDLSAEWDLVYGKGFFLANILGHAGIARAVLTCPNDTTLHAEFDSTKGVAKDNKGNVFRLTF